MIFAGISQRHRIMCSYMYKFVKNKLFLIIEQARLKYIDYFLKVGEKWKRKK